MRLPAYPRIFLRIILYQREHEDRLTRTYIPEKLRGPVRAEVRAERKMSNSTVSPFQGNCLPPFLDAALFPQDGGSMWFQTPKAVG